MLGGAAEADAGLVEMEAAAAQQATAAEEVVAAMTAQLAALDVVENDVAVGHFHAMTPEQIDATLLTLTGLQRRALEHARTLAEESARTNRTLIEVARASRGTTAKAAEAVLSLSALLRAHGIEPPGLGGPVRKGRRRPR